MSDAGSIWQSKSTNTVSLSIFVEEVVDLLFDRHDSSAGKWLQLVVNLSVIEGNGPNGLG